MLNACTSGGGECRNRHDILYRFPSERTATTTRELSFRATNTGREGKGATRARGRNCPSLAININLQSEQEEAAKTRGTPVTVASFKEWKAKFDKEMALRKAREEEERLRALSPKEREEYKKVQTRYTGPYTIRYWHHLT